MLLAGVVACSNNSDTPTSPTGSQPGEASAGPNNETLKATAPTLVSPLNNAQPQGVLILTANKSTSPFSGSSGAYSYEFEVRRGGNAVSGCSGTVGGGSGSTVSFSPSCSLDFDQPYTWRARAVFQNRQGPWSADGAFRAPAGGFLRANAVFDPLTNGRTVGETNGSVTFLAGVGARMDNFESNIRYVFSENLQEGEFSLMTLGIDEGNDGDKTKVMSMQEGFNDITANDYRMTVEKRGRRYSTPGAVTFRIITGGGEDTIFDGHRTGVAFSDENWYFWRFTWRTGFARLEVRQGSESGPTIYDTSTPTGSRPYRPVPHVLYVGAPVGRAGAQDATVPGMIVKNVWVSSSARPNFPAVINNPR